MYLICIHVPVYRQKNTLLVSTEWARSLVLLRDSFNGRFGEIEVLAPERDASRGSDQELAPVASLGEGFVFRGAFDGWCSPRNYWLSERSKWIEAVKARVPAAQVVHTGMNDLYRPINFDALRTAVSLKAKVVFVRDTDEVQKSLDLNRDASLPRKLWLRAYNRTYDSRMRWAVAHADLSLLKGQSLMNRYAGYARNPHTFHDTSASMEDVLPVAELETRLERARDERELRLVYCGRMEARKGVDESVRALSVAKAQGGRVTLDIIGDGQEKSNIQTLVRDLNLETEVRFLGKMTYGPELLRKLRSYDGLLFTPKGEDTPRMIFDAYAAGLPLLGYRIRYTGEREQEDHAASLVDLGDYQTLGVRLAEYAKGDRSELDMLARRARDAGLRHSVEHWYARRAELTFAMAQNS